MTTYPKYWYSILMVGLFIMGGLGCDTSFNPIMDDHKLNFSMYGTLDLHADTQWVRVMPLADQLIPRDIAESEVTVTLQNLETGEQTQLEDTLRTFPNGAHVLNYMTTQDLSPNTTYLVRAEDSKGASCSAEVTVPSSLDMPLVDYNQQEQKGTIRGVSEEPLVVANLHAVVQIASELGAGPEQDVNISFLYQIDQEEDLSYQFFVDLYGSLSKHLELNASNFVLVNDKQLTIATGSDDWPTYDELTKQEIHFPNFVSNVEGGVGYVAGIARRFIPLKSCYDQQGDLVPCPENRPVN
ncbi:MAG: hypothetical protein ACQETE_06520 [Bacteroidota bacterium]